MREWLSLLDQPGLRLPLVPVDDQDGTIPENKTEMVHVCPDYHLIIPPRNLRV